MVVFDVDHDELVGDGFDPGPAPEHGELRAAPVDDAIALDVPVEQVAQVPQLDGAALADHVLRDVAVDRAWK